MRADHTHIKTMIAAIVLMIGLLLLGVQITDPSSNITLASELSLPPDKAFTDWAVLDRPLHLILYDVPLAGLFLFGAGVIYWASDWLNEKIGLIRESAPASPAENEAARPVNPSRLPPTKSGVAPQEAGLAPQDDGASESRN
jgi:hypothetical protein